MKESKYRYYIAYGSNLNLEQMAQRCPTAYVVGSTTLKNWRLLFRDAAHTAVATVERAPGCAVPVLIWRIQPGDERALDRYEGWPRLYRKEILRITVNGRRVYAMIYIMNEQRHPYGAPSSAYFDTILTGYYEAGFDPRILREVVLCSLEARDRS